jgi:sarcosine oxidase
MTDIDRRSLLAGTVAGTLLASAKGAVAQPAKKASAPAINRNLPDITVVGAGAFGTWTALCLRERGAKVTLLDSYGAGNARQTSGDETRMIRCNYDDKEIYSRWAAKAFSRWNERQEEFGRRLIFPNGALAPNVTPKAMAVTTAIFKKLNIPFEVLKPEECKNRWPQGRFEDHDNALWEPRAGTVKARESLIAAAEVFVQKGGISKIGMATPGLVSNGKMNELNLSDGTKLSTGMAIFACGPWLPKVFPSILANYLILTRSEIFYVGSPPGDLSYHWERFPNILFGGWGYSLSDVDYGYKVAPSGARIPMDPDADERIVSTFMIDHAREFVQHRVPGLIGQPIVASRVCTLENSNNSDYIIDTHPEMSNVWVAGGGSGHAFKMGPYTGEYIADRVTGVSDPAEEKALFALKAHAPFPPDRRRE